MKKIILSTAILLGVTNFAMAQNNEVKKSTETKKNYIEIVNWKKYGHKDEIKFISSSGNVVKTFKASEKIKKQKDNWLLETEEIQDIKKDKGLVIINKTKKIENYDSVARREMCKKQKGYSEICAGGRNSAYPGEYWDKEVEILNKKGEIIVKKQFRTYPGNDLMTTKYWENFFSKDGNHFLIYYKDEKGRGNIEVYKTSGEKRAHGIFERNITNIQLSPDGSIAGGEGLICKKKNSGCIKHLFFLDVETGKTKIVKAEGKNDSKKWGAGFSMTRIIKSKTSSLGEVYIGIGETYIGKHNRLRSWGGFLKFKEIPDDLSSLFNRGKKK